MKRKVETSSGSRSLRKRVRFTPRGIVIGQADEADRVSTPASLYDCDVCGSRIHAGLRGFDLYVHCPACSFDACLSCTEDADAAASGQASPRSKAHEATCNEALVLVDRCDSVFSGRETRTRFGEWLTRRESWRAGRGRAEADRSHRDRTVSKGKGRCVR
ncbi:hypothetical protein M885DRAFT_541258 [Pelagophyceae sp. CCMP2097]|nr:hypothetical protein M885DRAFT_541258 [Pelagophyceae sp. CCMP2097]